MIKTKMKIKTYVQLKVSGLLKVSSNAALQMSTASSFHREGPALAKAITEGFKRLHVRKSSSCAVTNSVAICCF